MPKYAAALDQGTTSTRFMLFDHAGQVVAADQKPHQQIFTRAGWVEHDPLEIWSRTQEVIRATLDKANASLADIAAVGITNQRETTIVWDKATGQPVCNAIVWQDTRTDTICAELAINGGQDHFRGKGWLALATFFSGPKLKRVMENFGGVGNKNANRRGLFGTGGYWLILDHT